MLSGEGRAATCRSERPAPRRTLGPCPRPPSAAGFEVRQDKRGAPRCVGRPPSRPRLRRWPTWSGGCGMTMRIPRRRRRARMAREEYARSARTARGRVRGLPGPLRGTQPHCRPAGHSSGPPVQPPAVHADRRSGAGNIADDRRLAKPAIPRTMDSPPPLSARTSEGSTYDRSHDTKSSPPRGRTRQAITPRRSLPGTGPAPVPRPSACGAVPPGLPSRGGRAPTRPG